MVRRKTPTVLALALLWLAPHGVAQSEAGKACDPSSIPWFLPGDFESARAKAEASGRLLLIKGISFGVDDLGARCATKGKW